MNFTNLQCPHGCNLLQTLDDIILFYVPLCNCYTVLIRNVWLLAKASVDSVFFNLSINPILKT